MSRSRPAVPDVISRAVAKSEAIGAILIARNALQQWGGLYRRFHGQAPALIIADENTFEAAGREAQKQLGAAGIESQSFVLPAAPRPKPTVALGDELAAKIAQTNAVPVAVGSGVINDLVKYAAFRQGRDYSCIGTAASMDGYSSAGSPLSDKGFKITIQCRPPVAILADLDVIADAPAVMAGWGYGDLAGKMAAGGDWMIADALGIEPIDDVAWPLVQDHLRDWLSAPDAVATGDRDALADLFTGLTLVGLAMEFHGSSRPASGADHQIAHIWEMENLKTEGEVVAHGACVSIGTLTVLDLYDWLLAYPVTPLDIDRAMEVAETLAGKTGEIEAHFGKSEIARRACEETRIKHIEGDELRTRLTNFVNVWPKLKQQLKSRLVSANEMAALLSRAGAPVHASEIGVSRAHHKKTTLAARFIRSRYTILDTLAELGLLHQAVEEIFSRENHKERADEQF